MQVRAELLKKGTAYQHVWLYTLHELYDAIEDCTGANLKDNDKGVHAWDEGWAFYAGSQQSVGKSDGYMIYNLAQKRCGNFGTCAEDGVAKSNKKLLNYFNQGRDFLVDGKCTQANNLIPLIVSQMTVPLIQGTLRYAYKSDLWHKDQREVKCKSSVPDLAANKGKEIAEGWAFAAAVLPQLHKCDAGKAKLIRDNMDVMAKVPVKDTYSKVAHVLQSMYPCLGLTCEDIGGLENGVGTYFAGLEPCDDTKLTSSYVAPTDTCPGGVAGFTTTGARAVVDGGDDSALPSCGATPKSDAKSGFSKYATNMYKAPWDKSKSPAENKAAGACQIAGYAVGSDVTAHASLDLDQKAFEAKILVGDWPGAGDIYASGDANSMKSSGARTLKGFSTSVEAKMIAVKEPTALDYKAYWGHADYADKFVQAALNATTLPLSSSKVARQAFIHFYF